MKNESAERAQRIAEFHNPEIVHELMGFIPDSLEAIIGDALEYVTCDNNYFSPSESPEFLSVQESFTEPLASPENLDRTHLFLREVKRRSEEDSGDESAHFLADRLSHRIEKLDKVLLEHDGFALTGALEEMATASIATGKNDWARLYGFAMAYKVILEERRQKFGAVTHTLFPSSDLDEIPHFVLLQHARGVSCREGGPLPVRQSKHRWRNSMRPMVSDGTSRCIQQQKNKRSLRIGRRPRTPSLTSPTCSSSKRRSRSQDCARRASVLNCRNRSHFCKL